MKKLIFFLLTFSVINCTPKRQSTDPNTEVVKKSLSVTPKDSEYTSNLYFIGDSILPGLRDVILFYAKKYTAPNCSLIKYSKEDFKYALENPLQLGNIRKSVHCAVFVLLPFTDCNSSDSLAEGGKSYYFTDTTLPRLSADVFCTHPSNIFLIGDVDEDGVSEIGEYYSSCSSHYKSLRVWTLKGNKWHQIGCSTFDQRYMSYNRPYSSYVKKIGKGEFAMYEKTDLPMDSTKYKIGYWLKFKM